MLRPQSRVRRPTAFARRTPACQTQAGRLRFFTCKKHLKVFPPGARGNGSRSGKTQKRVKRKDKRAEVLLHCHFDSKTERKKKKERRTCANPSSCQLTVTSGLSPAPSSGLLKAPPAAVATPAFVKNQKERKSPKQRDPIFFLRLTALKKLEPLRSATSHSHRRVAARSLPGSAPSFPPPTSTQTMNPEFIKKKKTTKKNMNARANKRT